MKALRLLAASLVTALSLWAVPGTVLADDYYQLSSSAYTWDGTDANRLIAETAGQYQFDYGDSGAVTFDLPWSFRFYGQNYTRITADTNGNIWLGTAVPSPLPDSFELATTVPVISVWNNDLNSYYSGGVFVERKTTPERVVVHWRTETFADAGLGRSNEFEAVLFANGTIRFDYNAFDPHASGDSGSGISDGSSYVLPLSVPELVEIKGRISYVGRYILSLSDFGTIASQSNRSFLYTPDLTSLALTVVMPALTNLSAVTLTGTREADALITVTVNTTAMIGPVSYPSPTAWSCIANGLVEGVNTFTVTASDESGNNVAATAEVILDTLAEVSFNVPMSPTNINSQTLSGTREAEATVAVAVDTAAAVGPMSYPTPTTWSCIANGLVEGANTFTVSVTDAVGNVGTQEKVVVIDNTAPVTTISIGDPRYRDEALYVTGATEFTLAATDNLSGVAKTEYRINGGSWMAYTPFSLYGLSDGENLIEFFSVDRVLNAEAVQAVAVVVDNTPPETSIVLNHQSYSNGEVLLVSRDTEITLNAFDQLSGVAITQYRFDDSASWSPYDGNFRLTDLAYGVHSLHYRSIDNVTNREEEKSVIITLVGVEVETEILNRPRVLVWTEDPVKQGGNNRPSWSIEEVRALVDEALGVPDIYTTMTADKDDFRSLLRSGIYNMVMILNQDIPFDTIFLREMREAVNRGMGLLVSSWGNSVPPLWQEVFGVDFKGSLSMNEEERTLNLFDSPVSAVQSLTANGRVLRTVLDGGTLAGILPAESTCEGLRGLSLRYPQAMAVGDRVTVSLSVPQGKKSVVVDEEVLTISALPQGAVNRFTGNIAGDIAIGGIAAEGITLLLSSPYGYLEASYSLSVKVQRADGSIIAVGPVAITPVCGANLSADLNIGPFHIVVVEEDRVKTGNDLPAVVLGEYGEGRTAFLSYNIIESALKGQRSEHLGLLRRSATWLLPEAAAPEAGGVTLIESRVRLLGADIDLQAVDTMGEGLSHQPLFELTHTPLSYTFHLADGEQAVYRYFVRIADRQGDYDKTTAVLLDLDDGFVPFADYLTGFSVGDDSSTLLLKALPWVDGQLPAHPEAVDALRALREELVRIDTLPRTTPAETETLIHQTVQILHQVEQLTFDNVELRSLLDQYLRIVEGEGYFGR